MATEQTINYELISNFYHKITDIQEPKKYLRSCFFACLFSGMSFILTSITDSVPMPVFLNLFPLALLIYGLTFIVIAFYFVIKLVTKVF
jgi:hypothetical protein